MKSDEEKHSEKTEKKKRYPCFSLCYTRNLIDDDDDAFLPLLLLCLLEKIRFSGVASEQEKGGGMQTGIK